MKVKVSVIIPIYNVEEYLDECLTSVEKQTLKEIEILCVNDGSTDNSRNILLEHAKRDSRIKIIDQENSGSGIARNNAIKIAQGDYLGFLDPDDWILETMFEDLYNTAQQFDCDLVEEGYTLHNEQRNYTKRLRNKLNLPKNKVFSRTINKKYVFSNKLAVWNKLYRASFVKEHNILFFDTPRGQDIIFTLKSRFFAKRIVYIDKYDYQYRIRKTSVQISLQCIEDIEDCWRLFTKLKSEMVESDMYDSISRDCDKWMISFAYFRYRSTNKDNKQIFLEKAKEVLDKDEYNRFYRTLLFNNIKDNLFLVYNSNIDGQKYKFIRILGFEIKIPYGKIPSLF